MIITKSISNNNIPLRLVNFLISTCSMYIERNTIPGFYNYFFYLIFHGLPCRAAPETVAALSGRNGETIVFIRGDIKCTLTGNGENTICKIPGSIFTCSTVNLFGGCAVICINRVKINSIGIGGVVNKIGRASCRERV